MALTDYDKKNLSSSDQKKIQAATDKWNAANAKGDKEGMKNAAAEAAAVRNNAGYKTDSSGNYSGSSSGSSSNKNSQYTGGSSVDYGTLGRYQMANGASWQDVLDTYNARYNKATNTEGLSQYANDEIQNMMLQYINTQKAMEQYQNKVDELETARPDDYQSKYDPQIDALLNEILNRDDFSYDAMNDPLYQQYAKMYQREGDRAMKETLAEAAASAGGMNTYAITAAQQANSYYNSQLGDKIPELYQLAYEMYLNDKESKVQDLGILQNLDATQYNRYRDTINDYYNDKNFAYGAYQDAIQQGNWQTNFDYNAMWDNKTFNNDNYWKNKEFDNNNYWAEKEYADNRADIDYERNQYDEEKALKELLAVIETGNMPDEELIAKSGWSRATVEALVAQAKADLAKKVTTGSSRKKYNYEEEEEEQEVNNYSSVVKACEELAAGGDKWSAAAYAKEARDAGLISQEEYNLLLSKYNPTLDAVNSFRPPTEVKPK